MTTPAGPLSCLRCRARLPHCRGLCSACYKTLSLAVEPGEATWAALELAGQALAPQKAGVTWMHGFRIKAGRYHHRGTHTMRTTDISTTDMNAPDDFLALVEADLRLRHVPFDLAELRAFVEDVFPLVAPDDLPGRWAEVFLKSRRAEG